MYDKIKIYPDGCGKNVRCPELLYLQMLNEYDPKIFIEGF